MMRINKIYSMIKQAWNSTVSDDSEDYPTAQATSSGKINKITRLSVYGLNANPPADSHVLLLSSQGNESNIFGIANDFLKRKKDLKEGEVALYNTLTENFLYLREDETAEIRGKKVVIGDGTNELLDLMDQMLAEMIKLVSASHLAGNVDNPGTTSTGMLSLINIEKLPDMETALTSIQTKLANIKE